MAVAVNHYAGDDVAVAYNIIIDRIMNHGKIPSFAVKYRNQLSDDNAITLTWDGSQYVGTATDSNGVLSQYYFRANIMALTKELSFLPINAHDEFDILCRQLRGEDLTLLYLDEELQLAEQMFPPPEAEQVKWLLQSRAELSDVRRAAAFYKLQRYSYNASGDSYGVGSCDIRRFLRDIWECSRRLKDVVLENKDFEELIAARNDPQTLIYCDPPYYEAECYAVEFPRSDHKRLHDVLAAHSGFVMVSYNNCAYIRELYDDFYIYEAERPNSQSKKKNDKYQEYIMTNYDARIFAPQLTLFGDYANGERSCKLVHIPEKPLRTI